MPRHAGVIGDTRDTGQFGGESDTGCRDTEQFVEDSETANSDIVMDDLELYEEAEFDTETQLRLDTQVDRLLKGYDWTLSPLASK